MSKDDEIRMGLLKQMEHFNRTHPDAPTTSLRAEELS